MRKDVIKSLISIKQDEIPFDVIERDIQLPVNRKKIITIPGVRRCGKSTLMEITINELVRRGVSRQRILWLGFDDERLKNMSSEELDEVITSYMEMFPDIPVKDVYMFFDEIQLIKISVVRYFVKRLMANLTKPTSINGIYRDIKSQGLKIGKDDLYLWADYICSIFMFIRIPKYDRSLIKEQKSLDKYYCIDNGMRRAVLMPQSNDDGKNLENTVFMQLNRMRLPSDKISYYQGRGECDFVLQRGDSVVQLLQVTWSLSEADTCERELAGILEASAVTGCDNLLIVTREEEKIVEREGKQIRVVPAWKWLLGE